MNRVKELRIRRGMQQKELAVELGITQPPVSDWERQKADPSRDNLKRLSELFGVTPDYILCLTDVPNGDEGSEPRTQGEGRTLSDADLDAIARRVQAQVPQVEPDDGGSPVLVALYGDVHDLTDAEAADVRDYIKFLKSKRK